MVTWDRRTLMCHAIGSLIGGIAACAFVPPVAQAAERSSIKIGYVVSKTGVNAGGAGTTVIPNYELWAKDVNDAGGLALPDGKKLPLEIVAYDDRSSTEEVVRGIERLATQDKVDFVLAPWGTGFNMAVAPLMDRRGYPHLAVTAVVPRASEHAKRWKKSFWFLGGGADYVHGLANAVDRARKSGSLNNKVAIVSIADGFGIELVTDARPVLKKLGFEIVLDKTYPLGTQDFGTLVSEAKASGADTFLAFSYPPDTFALTRQARLSEYNPKVFYVGVGGSFPVYPKLNDGQVEGVMSLGGIDPNNQALKAYRARHEASLGKSPDFWASPIVYASLQMLQQAIARQGLDREAVARELSTGSFDTVIGTIKLTDNQLRDLWWVGQWHKGQFVAVEPAEKAGAGTPVVPKPAWK